MANSGHIICMTIVVCILLIWRLWFICLLFYVLLDDGRSERITIADGASSSQHAVTEFRVIETSAYGTLLFSYVFLINIFFFSH